MPHNNNLIPLEQALKELCERYNGKSDMMIDCVHFGYNSDLEFSQVQVNYISKKEVMEMYEEGPGFKGHPEND